MNVTFPLRPESIDWIRDAYWAQINFLVREEGWKPAAAEAYTLIACCAPTAMARATRDMLQLRRMSSATVHAGAGDYRVSRQLVAELLLELALAQVCNQSVCSCARPDLNAFGATGC